MRESIKNTVPRESAIIVSGGIDSTLMAAYTAELDNEMGWQESQRQGYTIQLEHQPKYEAEWARSLCKNGAGNTS